MVRSLVSLFFFVVLLLLSSSLFISLVVLAF